MIERQQLSQKHPGTLTHLVHGSLNLHRYDEVGVTDGLNKKRNTLVNKTNFMTFHSQTSEDLWSDQNSQSTTKPHYADDSHLFFTEPVALLTNSDLQTSI